MSAVLRCCCRRCNGTTFLRVSDYLADHQLDPGEYVLDREVTVELSRNPHAEVHVLRAPVRSLFTDPEV